MIMNLLMRVTCLILLTVTLVAVHAVEIDRSALLQDTLKMSSKNDDMTAVCWISEEIFSAGKPQPPAGTTTQREQFLKSVRPYIMIMVLESTMDASGNFTYKSEKYLRANTRLIDSQGNSYAPRPETEELKSVTQLIEPAFAEMIGPRGKNMHLLFFPAKTDRGVPIARPTSKGEFKVKLADNEFRWRLPLDSFLPHKVCSGCGEEGKGSWTFCPWCGLILSQKQ